MTSDQEEITKKRLACEKMRSICAEIRRHNALMDCAVVGLRSKTDELWTWLVAQNSVHPNRPGVFGASGEAGANRKSDDERTG